MANQYLSKIKIPGITDPLIIRDTEAHSLISQLNDDEKVIAAALNDLENKKADKAYLNEKADKATTLAGYGIIDAYTKSETYTKTLVNGLVDTPHQEYVTVDTYSSLPAIGSKDTIYRVSNYNGSTGQIDASVYSEYAWDGSQYTFLCVKSQIGEVFDISVYNNNTKYADLAAALDSNNGGGVPQSLQKGGMSVKFVQSSDNKYVQYRLTADEWSTDTDEWAIADEGVYVDNPEFVYVKTDAENKILYGVKKDGDFYFGAGVPSQIQEELDNKADLTILAEVAEVAANKVDKEAGKSLINTDYASSQSTIDNSKYLQVTIDSEDRILEGITVEGAKQINLPIDTPSVAIEHIDNPEWLQVTTDSEGKILEGIRKNGKKVFYGEIEGMASEEYVDEYVDRRIEDAVPIEYIHEDAINQYLVVGKDNEGAKQHHCVAVGIDILTNNTGIKNTVIGCDSMHDCTGHDNTAMGYHSSYRNTAGNYNAAFGSESQDDNTEGSENTSVGYCSMQRNNLGSLNTAVGAYALQGKGIDHFEPGNLKTFTRNVAVGANAMFDASTGSQYNIAIGYCALGSRKQYNYNIAIGEYVDCDKDCQTIIGSSHTLETIVVGDFIVKGTDGKKRKIIFNDDNTCSWELIEN